METPKPTAPEFFVLIDAGHGGEDSGAIFRNKLAEKDVTLSFARQLRSALENRGIGTRMMRDFDTTVSLERRAEAANGQHTGIYVALHAGEPGTGVRVYAPLLSSPSQGATGRFIPWDAAQTSSLPRSKAIADAVARELEKTDFPVTRLSAPLRPLNNIVAPAIAVEIATDPDDLQVLTSARTHSAIASAVASGIAKSRGQASAQ
jgi:N-acetylmuramoyl-L-alanine amidase